MASVYFHSNQNFSKAMKETFNQALLKIVEKKKNNNTLYTKSKYDEIVGNLEDDGKTRPKDYWASSKFTLLTLGDGAHKRLILNIVSDIKTTSRISKHYITFLFAYRQRYYLQKKIIHLRII